MKTISIETDSLRVRNVWFNREKVYFDLQDGRIVQISTLAGSKSEVERVTSYHAE